MVRTRHVDHSRVLIVMQICNLKCLFAVVDLSRVVSARIHVLGSYVFSLM